jgi:Type IV secretion-system coupling protein DNA-binding domain
MTAALLARADRRWFSLRWPHEVTLEQSLAALLSLNGLSTPRRADAILIRTTGEAGHVVHHLAVPAPRATGARHQLESAIPGLTVEPVDEIHRLVVDRTWLCWLSSRTRPLDLKHSDAVARGVITALASAQADERLVMQWVLGPVRRPIAVGARVQGVVGPGAAKWLMDLARGPADLDTEARSALTNKQGLPGWRATLHLGVKANGNRRQLQLLGRLAAAVRVAQGPGVQVGFNPARNLVFANDGLPFRRPLLINVGELKGLAGWPLGPTEGSPVERVRSRLVPPSRAVPRNGRVVAEATYPSAKRPLALSARDSLQHLHVVGPTGTGKTTLLLNLVVQDMAAGRSVVVIEPKGDLVRDVLERVPDSRLDDVVVVDPTDKAPVGLNPLAARGVPSELKAEHLLTIFKGLFADSWGPRTQDILTAGLLTLTATPGMSLVALPLLYTDARFRQKLLARVRDPLALDPFWDWFETLSSAERATVLAPVMNKLRAFLLRERLRRVIGQARPRFDLTDVYRKRRILLVNLATGALGPESATLLGSLVVSQLWQTVLGRTAVPSARRHPVMVVIDEFQNYLHLPTDLADVLAQARGLGVGLTLAHQHLAQLHPSVRAAVLANARSRVTFTTGHDDASVLVRSEGRLTPADLTGLGKYEVYASLIAGSESTPFASARTLPPPPAIRPASEVQQRSRERWGVPAGVVDVELEGLVEHRSTGKKRAGATSTDEVFGVTGRRHDVGEASS